MRHAAVCHRVDHLGPVLDNAPLLVGFADHVTGGVLNEYERRVDLVRELDELARLERLLGEEHADVVGEDPDRKAVDRRPASDEVSAVQRLPLVQATAIHNARDHFADGDRHLDIDVGDAEQLVDVVDRRVGRLRRTRTELAPIQPLDDLAANADAVDVVLGHEIRDARDARVHLGTTELLVVGDLACRHLDQRWAAEEDLRLLPDHDDVVAKTRHVSASRGRIAKHQGDGRNAKAG